MRHTKRGGTYWAATQDAFDECSMISFVPVHRLGRAHYYCVGTHMYNMSGRFVHCMALGVWVSHGDLGMD